MLTQVTLLVFALALGAAAAMDLRARRIPNALTVGMLTAGLLLAAAQGWGALGASLAGALGALAVGLAVFALGLVGGGDAKLLAAVGAFVGWAALPQVLLHTALAGGALALGMVGWNLALTRRLPQRAHAGPRGRSADAAAPREARSVPYGVAIAAGALVTVFVRGGP